MKALLQVAVAVIAFLGNVVAENEWVGTWSVSNEPFNPSEELSVPADQVVNGNSQRQLAGPAVPSIRLSVKDQLPITLPIGDVWTIRNHMVASNGINVLIALGFNSTNGVWTEARVSKNVNGYASYADALIDFESGAQRVLAMMADASTYPAGGDLYTMLDISNFRDTSMPTPLWLVKKVGPLEGLTVEKMVEPFHPDYPLEPSSERKIEQVVIPLQNLKALECSVEVKLENGETELRIMTWSATSGVTTKSSTWPPKPVERTQVGYLCINWWLAIGQHPARIRVTNSDDVEVAYTQFGGRVTGPSLKMVNDEAGLAVIVYATKGSNVDLLASQDNKSWTSVVRIFNAEPVTRINLTGPVAQNQFFQTTAR